MRVGRSWALPMHRSNETPPEPDAAVPQRSVRRATARRASSRRHAAREHQHPVDERIAAYVEQHPDATTGEIAKALNADRGEVAAGIAHLARAAEEDEAEAASPAPREAT